MGTYCITQGVQLGALWKFRWMGKAERGRSKGERIHVYLQLIHCLVQQRLIEHCKATTVVAVSVTKLVWLFWRPMDCSLPGYSVYVFSQVKVLEWVAIFFSKWSSAKRWNPHLVHLNWHVGSLLLSHQRCPNQLYSKKKKKKYHGTKGWLKMGDSWPGGAPLQICSLIIFYNLFQFIHSNTGPCCQNQICVKYVQ